MNKRSVLSVETLVDLYLRKRSGILKREVCELIGVIIFGVIALVILYLMNKKLEPMSYLCIRGNKSIRVINTGYLNFLDKDEWYFSYIKDGESIEETFPDSASALNRVKDLIDDGYGDIMKEISS